MLIEVVAWTLESLQQVFVFFLVIALISWKSVKQGTISKSSPELEHKALSFVVSEVMWLKRLLTHF